MCNRVYVAEKAVHPASEAPKKVNNYIKRAFDILKQETGRVHKQMDALDEAAKDLEHVHSSKIVKLNVGGHLFSTNLETLTKDPGSMLHAMFSGRSETKPSEDGSYFIDRDGSHFRYILNYLRTGELIAPEDKIARRELLAEAKFYQVEGLVNELTTRPVKPFEDSVILSSDQRETLMNWLKESQTLTGFNNTLFPDLILLYRASRDGWHSFNFHTCCDNKGPTVTVVKSGNYIFGGFTEHQWETPCEPGGYCKTAPDSFLFSLVNPSGLPPTKMPLIAGQEEYAIVCDSSEGPMFGYDLQIVCSPNNKNCCTKLNGTYQCPAGQNDYTFLTGTAYGLFTVSELEVFGFEK